MPSPSRERSIEIGAGIVHQAGVVSVHGDGSTNIWRQRCAWCGTLLMQHTPDDHAEGQNCLDPYQPGILVTVDGDRLYVEQHRIEPRNACWQLDPSVI